MQSPKLKKVGINEAHKYKLWHLSSGSERVTIAQGGGPQGFCGHFYKKTPEGQRIRGQTSREELATFVEGSNHWLWHRNRESVWLEKKKESSMFDSPFEGQGKSE